MNLGTLDIICLVGYMAGIGLMGVLIAKKNVTTDDYFVGGRYIDRMEKRDGVWKITHRTGVNDWQRIEPPSSMGLSKVDPSSYGQQGKGDFLYRRKEVYGA